MADTCHIMMISRFERTKSVGMTLGSLFAGIGGFELGLLQSGLVTEVKWQVEIDGYCRKVLERHFPETPKWDDIKTFTLDISVNLLYNRSTQKQKEVIDTAAHRKKYNEAVKLYNSGLSIGDVADFYSISRQAMWMILKRRGCVFRQQKKYGEDNHFYRGTTASDYAQNIVEKAIKKGIIKPQPCERCGAHGKFRDGRNEVQAHHSNYNKPLDVVWLCQKCHYEWHKNNKAIPREEVMQDEVSSIPTVDVISGGFP